MVCNENTSTVYVYFQITDHFHKSKKNWRFFGVTKKQHEQPYLDFYVTVLLLLQSWVLDVEQRGQR